MSREGCFPRSSHAAQQFRKSRSLPKKMMNPVIEVCALTKAFRQGRGRKATPAVDNVTFDVFQGEVFGLLGENGAGKTTALELILGLLRPDSGEIRVFGKKPGDLEANGKIGYLPEMPRFHTHLSGEEFLHLHGELFGLSRPRRRVLAKRLLSDFGLEVGKKRIAAYSRGMLQRIGLAQALISSPKVLFLDEPTSGMDPPGVRLLRNIILGLRESGVCVFLNSHHLSEVERVCDRVAFMKNGRIREIVDLRSLRNDSFGVEITLGNQIGDVTAALDTSRVLDLRESATKMKLTVEVNDESEIDELVEILRRRGGRIVSVIPKRVSLEQLFFKYVS